MTLPHKIDLDRMVRGEAAPEEAAWGALLSSPDASAAWTEAHARRGALDQTAALAWRRPWLARTWLGLRRAGRRLAERPDTLPSLSLLEPGITLAALSAAPELVRRPLGLAWGEVRAVSVRPGQRVAPELGPEERLLWHTDTGEGALEQQDWLVEPDEGVVLLLAVRGPRPDSVDAALASGQPFAGLLLVPEGETEP